MSRRSARRYGFFAALALAALAGVMVMGRVPMRDTDGAAEGREHHLTPSPAASRGASAFFAPSRSFATARAIAGVRGAPVTTTPRGRVIADELVVRPGADAKATEQAIAAAGGRIAWRAPRTGLLLVRFASGADAQVARGQLGSDRRLGGIYQNRIMEGASLPATASEARAVQWHLAAMKVPAARSAAGVTVAVLDSGVAYEAHSDANGSYAKAPDLAATPFAAGWDFIHDDAHPNDDHGHGTHVAALVAGSEPVPGVGVGATILPVKVLDADNLGTELGLAEGIRYAVDHGADVVNMSLSFQAGFFPSRYLQDAVDHASAQGVVLVAAAGNQGGNAVAYPAAFREVIAVGASRIWDQYRSPASSPWQAVEQYLRRAEYSNRGFRLDVVAPGGGLDGDTNLDGAADTVVAQTIVPGQPTQFEYRLWAGTSQAAAQVSGVVALMLATDPSLSAADIRSILGETAAPEAGGVALSSLVGRGFLRVDAALAAVAAGTAERPRFAAAVRVALVASGGVRRGRATVEVLDSAGAPVADAQVYGTFTGGAFAVQHGVTGADGTVSFLSPDLGTAPVVAFQVDAVATSSGAGAHALDRPSGAIKIDSCSLQLLSEYAEGAGLGSSPVAEGPTTGTGLGSSPGDSDGNTGSGLGSSPDDPVGGAGLGSSPDDPRDLIGGAGLGSSPDDPENLTGGAGLGSSPMCANLLGDCSGLTSNGQGLGSSPVTQGAGGSFAGETQSLVGAHERLLALRMPTLPDEVDAVALLNLSWSGSTVPMVVAADAAWFAAAFPDSPVVQTLGQGMGSSPLSLDPLTSFSPALDALPADAGCAALVVTTFATGDVATGAPAVAVDPASCSTPTCEERASAVESVWGWASGAGLGSSPRAPRPQWSAATGWPEGEYDRLVAALDVWSTFAMGTGGSAAAAYDELLVGSGLDSTGETIEAVTDGASCGPELFGTPLAPGLLVDPSALDALCTGGEAP